VTVHSNRAAERWVLAASILGSTMSFIDGTVVNVALPALQDGLGATAANVQWVVEGYALSLSALLLLGGALGDRAGRRRIFVVGVALFAAASIACALSPGIHWLIAARVVQGIGGAMLVPGSLALLSANFPPDRRGKAIGTWSAFSAAATGVGPVLGGWLIQEVSWRAIFWINVPLAAATVVICVRKVPESRDPNAHGRLDLLGACLATIGLGALVFGLIEAPRLGFNHPMIATALAVGTVTMVLFVVAEDRLRSPMIPLGLFKSRAFSGANLLTLLLYAAIGGAMYFLPFDLIQVHHYSPPQAGAAMLPIVVLLFLLSGTAGRVADRYGARIPLVVGPMIATAGFALLTLPGTTGSYWTTFLPGITVLGLGMSVSVAPLTTTVMRSVGTERAGVASGINNAVSRVAMLLAVAALGVVASVRFGSALDERLRALRIPPGVQDQLSDVRAKLAGAPLPKGLPPELRLRLREAIDGSFVEGFRTVMWVAALLAVGAGLVAWAFIHGTPQPRKPQA
jgi:EmrB/QacA subfamily drug resistance transporter